MPADMMLLEPDFEAAAAAIVDADSAQAFVEQYGTHFVARAEFGGMLSLNTWVESQYAFKLDSKFFSRQVEASFEMLEAPLHNKTADDIDIDEKFKRKSERSLFRTGGDQSYNDKEELPLWRDSVPLFPGLLNTTEVYPIEDLVPEGDARVTLHRYIKSYLK